MLKMEDVMRLKVRVAKAALMPIRVPFFAFAFPIDHASVHAQGLAFEFVLHYEFSQFSRSIDYQMDEIAKGNGIFVVGLTTLGSVGEGRKVFPTVFKPFKNIERLRDY